MNTSARGLKHLCQECGGKYYDLGKKVVACPKCGTKPPAPKLRKAVLSTKRPVRSTTWRYP